MSSKQASEQRLRVIRDSSSGLEVIKLGERVRQIRHDRQWTLDEVSQRTGLAKSTLSKIENEQVSPTLDVMRKLVVGLEVEFPQLFEPPRDERALARRALTRKDQGQTRPSPTYEHELLCTEISNKRMFPFKSRVRARSFEDFEDWVRHSGEEFLLVLEGDVQLLTEFYEPAQLTTGDSAYYDSSMGHAVVSVSAADALILWVSVGR